MAKIKLTKSAVDAAQPQALAGKGRQGGNPARIDPSGKPTAVAGQWPVAGRAPRLHGGRDSALSTSGANASHRFAGRAGWVGGALHAENRILTVELHQELPLRFLILPP
ncbi:hypothetical protein [Bordetella hinzii]|uniref:hypothetical protein n=1 Tax=Bordetella hinzii TaxID=103855 RepID=UPI00163B9088|nr:hypothetical protein [Bordetella hinzii]